MCKNVCKILKARIPSHSLCLGWVNICKCKGLSIYLEVVSDVKNYGFNVGVKIYFSQPSPPWHCRQEWPPTFVRGTPTYRVSPESFLQPQDNCNALTPKCRNNRKMEKVLSISFIQLLITRLT